MKVIGIRAVPVKKIILPGNWREILQSEEAKARGQSIKEHGIIHEPVVRKVEGGRFKIVAGRRRVAGMVSQGMDQVPCKVITCTDDEAVDLEEIENIERWHNPTEQQMLIRRRVARLTGEGEKAGKSKRKAKGDAIRRVAKEKGIKPESVKQAMSRAKKAQQEEADPEEPPIKSWGLDMSEDGEWLEGIREVQVALKDATARARFAMNLVARIRNSATAPIGQGTCDRLREELSSVAANLEAWIPTCVCPYCKMIPDVMEKCPGCMGQGWMGSTSQVPPELQSDSPCLVVFGGDLVPYEQFWEEEE